MVAQLQQHDGAAAERLLQRLGNLRVAEWEVWAASDEPSLVDTLPGRRLAVLDTETGRVRRITPASLPRAANSRARSTL